MAAAPSSHPSSYVTHATALAKWLGLSCLIGALVGSAAAFFLWALGLVTAWRLQQPWLLCLLPAGGFVVAWLYLRYGVGTDAGINRLITEVRTPTATVPLRMAPLVLFGTLVSHWFGASVGREGTAVQIGGALADQFSKRLRVDADARTIILAAGMGAGFAAVFGTPLAGAAWAIEVLAVMGFVPGWGALRRFVLPCLLSAVLANAVALALGAQHQHYPPGAIPAPGWGLLAAVAAAGLAFGVAARAFTVTTRALATLFKRIAYAPLRPLVGGAVIVAVVLAVDGASRYLGLGLPTLQAAFTGSVAPHDFLAKLLMTAWSVASGFKGGEVTPLFFIGATLGHVLGPVLAAPPALLAALGLAAVFAGASNTPLASTLLAIELFGPAIGGYAALACWLSYLVSGRTGIYPAQRLLYPKLGRR